MAVDIKKIKRIVNQICNLTIEELCKLVNALRDKFGLRTPDTIKPDINSKRETTKPNEDLPTPNSENKLAANGNKSTGTGKDKTTEVKKQTAKPSEDSSSPENEAVSNPLKPTKNNKKDKSNNKNKTVRRGSGGEKEPHITLKNYIAKNPSTVKLNESLAPGEIEYELPSLDRPDILFQDTHCRIVVEVKPRRSGKEDLKRGLFQCIKYRALLEACRIVEGKIYEVDAILAIGGSLPKELIPIRDKLNIKVIENIQVK